MVTKENLFEMLNLLEQNSISYWVDGGWGVDILAGRQTRVHHDLDLDVNARQAARVLRTLHEAGFIIRVGAFPVRTELYSQLLGYVDVHPFVFSDDGSARQADGLGGWHKLEADYFGEGMLCGRRIPCISLKGQQAFHTGYELREKDLHDLRIIEQLARRQP